MILRFTHLLTSTLLALALSACYVEEDDLSPTHNDSTQDRAHDDLKTDNLTLETSINQQKETPTNHQNLLDSPTTQKAAILSGWKAPEGRYMFYTALRLKSHSEAVFCGASLIHPRWVMTAAHCSGIGAENMEAGKIFVTVGEYDNQQISRYENQRRNTNFLVHPKWDDNPENGHDIALIRLDEPSNIEAVRIPTKAQVESLADDHPVQLAGMGLTLAFWTRVKKLHEIYLKFRPNHTCKNDVLNNMLSAISFKVVGTKLNSDDVVCTKRFIHEGQGKGDSGGPLVTTDVDGQMMQVGIVSFQPVIGYSYYTNPGAYKDWIDCIIKNDYQSKEEASKCTDLSLSSASPSPDLTASGALPSIMGKNPSDVLKSPFE